MIAALNGATYAFFKNRDDRAGLIMTPSPGCGFPAVVYRDGDHPAAISAVVGLNVFKAIVTGSSSG